MSNEHTATTATTGLITATIQCTESPEVHVHGPNCIHRYDVVQEQEEAPAAKYKTVADVPKLNIQAVFDTNEGPNWVATPAKMLERIHGRLSKVPEGEVIILMVSASAYQWLASNPKFRKLLRPSHPSQVQGWGFMGMFGPQCLVMCDAAVGLAITEDRAFYFCQEVVAPDEEATPSVETVAGEGSDAAVQ